MRLSCTCKIQLRMDGDGGGGGFHQDRDTARMVHCYEVK